MKRGRPCLAPVVHEKQPRYTDRPQFRSPKGTPLEVAERRAGKLGLTGSNYAQFIRVFKLVRLAEVTGDDTEPLWRRYNADPDGHIAVAAYIEAVASTRKPGYAE